MMRTQRKFAGVLTIFTLSLALILLSAGVTVERVASQPAPTPTPGPAYVSKPHITHYGMQFIDAGRTGRLTVENPRVAPGEIVPCIRVQIVLDYYEAAGDGSVRLAFVRRVTREIDLDRGEAASYDIPTVRGGSFLSVTLIATPEDAGTTEPEREILTSTFTVRELGRTILNLPAVRKGFDPQPDPPAISEK